MNIIIPLSLLTHPSPIGRKYSVGIWALIVSVNVCFQRLVVKIIYEIAFLIHSIPFALPSCQHEQPTGKAYPLPHRKVISVGCKTYVNTHAYIILYFQRSIFWNNLSTA